MSALAGTAVLAPPPVSMRAGGINVATGGKHTQGN